MLLPPRQQTVLLLLLAVCKPDVVTMSRFCDAPMASRFKIILRGGSDVRETNQSLDTDTPPYEEIVRMVEEMKSRVPGDEEVLSAKGCPVKMTNDPETTAST
eukprot:768381-Hanusia_phi.AAC.4